MKFLCVFFVIFGLASAAWGLEREAFTIAKYDLEIRLEPEQQRLGARGKITLRNDSAHPQKIVALQISSSLSWRSIRVDGKAVQFVSQTYTSDIDHTGALSEAIVTLPVEIKPNASVEVEIGYEGVIPLHATRLVRVGVPEEIAKHSSWDQISPSFTAVRGAGYVAWYPITTESADFSEGNSLFEVTNRWKKREQDASMKLSLSTDTGTYDRNLLLLCNSIGNNNNIDAREGSTHDHYARCEYERFGLATPTFAMANYQDRSKPPFYLFSFPGHEAGAATYSNALEPAAKFVSEWFGPPRSQIGRAHV